MVLNMKDWKPTFKPHPLPSPTPYLPNDLNIFVMQRFFCSMFGCT